MKNHVKVDGKLLQTNKTWGHLKRKQQDWIFRTARARYDRFLDERGKLPVEGSKKRLIEEIYSDIQERDIWIPYGEVYRVLCKRIAHWNRQMEAGMKPFQAIQPVPVPQEDKPHEENQNGYREE